MSLTTCAVIGNIWSRRKELNRKAERNPINTQPRQVTSLSVAAACLILTTVAGLDAPALQPQILADFSGIGGGPGGNLVLGPDGSFYGSAQGVMNNGTLFQAGPDGSLNTIFFFDWFVSGADPWSKLTFGTDGSLYGTTFEGGAYQCGTLFKVTTNGLLTTLVHLNGAVGSGPMAGMLLGQDGNFYGTTRNGGANGFGNVYRLTPVGTLTTLASFAATNGARPQSDLIQGKDGNFYGTTYYGGLYDDGTVFQMTPAGKLTTLVHFNGSNGSNPWGAMVFGNDGQLYGTTYGGGSADWGTIFKINSRGKLTTLVTFTGQNGIGPIGSLLLAPDGNFYGTTADGGAVPFYDGLGTIFKMTPSGTLTTLYAFTPGSDGNSRPRGGLPYGGLIVGNEGSLYGTTYSGGGQESGILYRLDLPPTITSEPQSRFKARGTMVSFSVAAVGTRPFSYQWLKDGNALSDGRNVSGSQSNVLTLSNLQDSDAGDYSVVVTNVAGSATSSTAELTVLPHGHSAVQALAANVPNPSGQTNLSGTGPLPLISTPPVNVLTLEGSPNYSYVVQYTANFLNGPWQILSTNTADTNGTCVVIDPSPTDSQRFYRCVSQ
jgi:uncharacterized repeat protein (TIGR03803 family)